MILSVTCAAIHAYKNEITGFAWCFRRLRRWIVAFWGERLVHSMSELLHLVHEKELDWADCFSLPAVVAASCEVYYLVDRSHYERPPTWRARRTNLEHIAIE